MASKSYMAESASGATGDVLRGMLREQLAQRRERLQRASSATAAAEIKRLLRQVDAALDRVAAGTYGLCEFCHEPIEAARLISDPLAEFCLDHLPAPQKRALERDLETTARLQARLLPEPHFRRDGWHITYHYKPFGVVSGDYCDVVRGSDATAHFIVGDVAGKGIAASMLMANLNVLFRTLIDSGVPLAELMERANRMFGESTLPTIYATIVCGKAFANGEVEICNAGHVPSLLASDGKVTVIEANTMPIGLFTDQPFSITHIRLQEGDALVLLSDGISEARNDREQEYGTARLGEIAKRSHRPGELLTACLQDLREFRGAVAAHDDETLMIVERARGNDRASA